MAIETILVAVGPGDADRVDRLAEEAVDFGSATGATVVLAHVFTDEEYQTALDDLDFNPEAHEFEPDDVARRHSTIRKLVAALDEADVDTDVRGAVGDHGKLIVEIAEDVGADQVIVGGRRRSPAGKAVFGSVAQEVMLNAPCPVTFVRADTS
jgi:nucleotide-binding universal stress UspA family protein